MDDEIETTGLADPPPLIFTAALPLQLALGMAQPQTEKRARFAARAVGGASVGASVVAGIAPGGAAIVALKRAGTAIDPFKRAGTAIDPFKPSTALVTGAIFAFSRNPGYVGATSIDIGIAMYARSLPAFTLLPIVLALLDRLVVSRDAVPRWF